MISDHMPEKVPGTKYVDLSPRNNIEGCTQLQLVEQDTRQVQMVSYEPCRDLCAATTSWSRYQVPRWSAVSDAETCW